MDGIVADKSQSDSNAWGMVRIERECDEREGLDGGLPRSCSNDGLHPETHTWQNLPDYSMCEATLLHDKLIADATDAASGCGKSVDEHLKDLMSYGGLQPADCAPAAFMTGTRVPEKIQMLQPRACESGKVPSESTIGKPTHRSLNRSRSEPGAFVDFRTVRAASAPISRPGTVEATMSEMWSIKAASSSNVPATFEAGDESGSQ